MDDIRRFVSLVNWHFTFRLEHSEQLVVSVASHFTFRSRQASQLGSFLLCRYALFCACIFADICDPEAPGVPLEDPVDAVIDSIPGGPGEVAAELYGFWNPPCPKGRPDGRLTC
jgi:hypothetical protein